MWSLILLATGLILIVAALKLKQSMSAPPHLSYFPVMPFFTVMWNFFIAKSTARERVFTVGNRYGESRVAWIFGKWIFISSNVEFSKKVFNDTETFQKNDMGSTKFSMQFFGKSNIVSANGNEWKRQRIICNPAFHWEHLHNFMEKFINSVHSTLTILKLNQSTAIQRLKEINDTVDVSLYKKGLLIEVVPLMQNLTLDVLGKTIFDVDFHVNEPKGACKVQENGSFVDWANLYNRCFKGVMNPLLFLVPYYASLPIEKNVKLGSDISQFRSRIAQMISEREKEIKENKANGDNNGNKRTDLLSMMIKSARHNTGNKESVGDGNENDDRSDNEESDSSKHIIQMTDEELANNICIFFLAGHDTTSTTLSMVLYHLANNQDCQDKCRAEIMEVFQSNKFHMPTFEDQKKLLYVTQVIKETLRLFPPVGTLPTRRVTKDVDLDGVVLKEGDSVQIDILGVHYNPNLWPDPEKFDPDRFGPTQKHHPFAWMPFGMGSRGCIGLNFSLQEQRVFLSMFLSRYRVKPGPINLTEEQKRTGFGFDVGSSSFLMPKNMFLLLEEL